MVENIIGTNARFTSPPPVPGLRVWADVVPVAPRPRDTGVRRRAGRVHYRILRVPVPKAIAWAYWWLYRHVRNS